MKTILHLSALCLVLLSLNAASADPIKGPSLGNERWERPNRVYFEFYEDGTCASGNNGVPPTSAPKGTWKAVGVRDVEIKLGKRTLSLRLTSGRSGMLKFEESGEGDVDLRFVKKLK